MKNIKIWYGENSYYQLVRKMRITVFLLFITVASLFAAETYAQTTKLNLRVENAEIAEVLQKIEKQSEFRFFYNERVDVGKRVTIHVINKTVFDILDQVLEGTGINYKIMGQQIALFNSDNPFNWISQQQQRTVSGKVTDSSGLPLPGVTVVVKGTTQGTVTDADGEYSLTNLAEDAILQFSFVGMKTQEIKVGNQTAIDVVMVVDAIGIEEVVAIGYGTIKKKDLTGSISSFSSKDFEKEPVKAATTLLQGRVAGIVLTNNNNELGSTPKIRIRGMNSINGSNNPLVVIDGEFSLPDALAGLNTNDILSLDILKDASATAIYGSRGANGVVIVTTKRGTIGELSINFRSDIGISVPKKWDLLNASEFAESYNEYSGTAYFSDTQIAEFKEKGGTDWQDAIYNTGLNQSYNLVMKGGTKKVKFRLSGSYLNNTANYINAGNQIANVNGKFDFNFTDKLSALLDFGLEYGSIYGGTYGNGRINGPTMNALLFPATFGIYDGEDGTYLRYNPLAQNEQNPYMIMKETNLNMYSLSGRIRAMVKYKILNGLDISSDISLSNGLSDRRTFSNKWLNLSYSLASRHASNGRSLRLTNLVSFNRLFAERHNVNITMGHEMTGSDSYGFYVVGRNYPSDSYEYNNLGLATGDKSINSSFGNSGLMSFFGRLKYGYKSKYHITATYRWDGSSIFAEGNKWSSFPSIGASWNASNEDFIKELDIFDVLKLRYSWGISGSQAASAYSTMTFLQNERFAWITGGEINVGVKPQGNLPNIDLGWEKTAQHNAGVDIGFFNERLYFSFDYYNKTTTDLLFDKLLPWYTGSEKSRINLGSMRNEGIEANIHVGIVTRKDWSWDASFNTFFNKNEVIDIGGQSVPTGDYLGHVGIQEYPFLIEEGKPLGQFYGWRFLGLWQESERDEAQKFGCVPGDSKYKDFDNNGAIDSEDREVIGNAIPKFNWGFNSNARWKDFTLSAQVEGVHGVDALAATWAELNIVAYASTSITGKDGLNYWTPSNTNTIWAPPSSNTNIEKVNSDKYVMDASFIKLRNLSLAYDVPKRIMKNNSLQVFISAQNLFTITNYKGLDPESSRTGNSDTQMNVDFGTYATPRIFSLGLNLNL